MSFIAGHVCKLLSIPIIIGFVFRLPLPVIWARRSRKFSKFASRTRRRIIAIFYLSENQTIISFESFIICCFFPYLYNPVDFCFSSDVKVAVTGKNISLLGINFFQYHNCIQRFKRSKRSNFFSWQTSTRCISLSGHTRNSAFGLHQ